MTRVTSTISIERPISEVFEYVTTPGNWPEWHPSSVAVHGATDHSLLAGEQVTEEFFVAGRRGRVVWTVREREEPRRWVIDGRIEGGGGGGTITYLLAPNGGGTTFERVFDYTIHGLFAGLLDRLVIRRRVNRESAEALRALKRVLEMTAEE